MSNTGRPGFLERLSRRRQRGETSPVSHLPDPARPPQKRGTWEEAALTNVDVTEFVKEQIRTRTRPWQK
jgi:hypothetical protein